jgi:hypothetical protein
MKFYSYTNKNNNYTKAVTLEGVRSLHLHSGDGKSVIRFSVGIEYANGRNEQFHYLENDEAKQVYKTILDLLNNDSEG